MNPEFSVYNCLDAACTLQCRNEFWADLREGYEPAYKLTVDLFEPIIFMQTRGVLVDHQALEVTKREILTAATDKQEELNRLCGKELNVNSPKACMNYFYVELGITPYYNEGAVTVDDTALQRIARGTAKRPGLRQAKLVQEIRGLQKLHGTYLDMEFDADGRMRCSYNARGTKYGRLSSSKTVFGSGSNFQNLPQEFKKFLVADPGYVLVELDKVQAEWVVVAYLTGDANMLSVVESGQDTHVHTASLMFGVPHEVIELEWKLVGSNTDPDLIASLRYANSIVSSYMDKLPRTMSGRQAGKKNNHGRNYGEGDSRYALLNEMEQSEAKRQGTLYHSTYPGIQLWWESIKRQLQRERTLTNCFGRKVRFMDSWGPDLWKAAYSMLPQSTVVDSLNQGMIKIYNDPWLCVKEGAPYVNGNIDILAQVHDSILLQVPVELICDEEDFEAARIQMYQYISPALTYNGRTFKIATDMKVGLNWSGYHKESNPTGMREVKNEVALRQTLESLLEPRTG